jgi:hypothetical protein
MFVVNAVNMGPVAAGTGSPLVSAVFDGDALLTMLGVFNDAVEAYTAVSEAARAQGEEEVAQHYHNAAHELLPVLAALDSTLQAIDSLDICHDCGEPKLGHTGHAPVVDPEEFSDENLAQVMELFKGGE